LGVVVFAGICNENNGDKAEECLREMVSAIKLLPKCYIIF
jgi:pentatricopeptide repeat protein